MRKLIFGCGYLGQRIAIQWLAEGHEVFALTRSAENAERLRKIGLSPIIGDLCDPDSLQQIPEAEVALNAVGYDRQSGRSQQEVTVGGLQNLLSTIAHRVGHFIQISSTSVYGQSSGEWVTEDSECLPVQQGGKLALAAEQLVCDWLETGTGIRATILRLAGIYGPGRLLSRIESLRNGSPIAGRSDSWLNLIHVDDAVSAIKCCSASCFKELSIFNVVDNRPIERHIYYEMLASLVNAPKPAFDAELPARGSGGLNKRCSNLRLRNQLKWAPAFPSIDFGLPASLQE